MIEERVYEEAALTRKLDWLEIGSLQHFGLSENRINPDKPIWFCCWMILFWPAVVLQSWWTVVLQRWWTPGYRVLCDAILSNLYLDPASQLQLWNLAEMLVLQHLKEDIQQLDRVFSWFKVYTDLDVVHIETRLHREHWEHIGNAECDALGPTKLCTSLIVDLGSPLDLHSQMTVIFPRLSATSGKSLAGLELGFLVKLTWPSPMCRAKAPARTFLCCGVIVDNCWTSSRKKNTESFTWRLCDSLWKNMVFLTSGSIW